jgi:hypothetical protein
MIRNALTHIEKRINEHFKNEFASDKMLVLSNLVNADGSVIDEVANKMVCCMVSLEEESTLKNGLNRTMKSKSGSFDKTPPILHFNMQLLFCANFIGIAGYEEGLAYLSSLIRFFQTNRIMKIPGIRQILPKDRVSSSRNGAYDGTNLSGPTQGITFELCKLDYSEFSHLWSAIGAKLMPSVVYKVGMISFDDPPLVSTIEPITSTKNKI